MTNQEICEKVVEKHGLMREAFDFMLDHAEAGFMEWKATSFLAEKYRALGYDPVMAGDIPGFYFDIDTGRPGPKVLVLAELDGLPVPGHPHADPETQVAHACGHNAQSAAMLGMAAVISDSAFLDGLSGSIRLCAVPAEEMNFVEFRMDLVRKGVIRYITGKQEFIRRGYLDGCDMAMNIHTGGGTNHFKIDVACNGGIVKIAEFTGKASHGSDPIHGINALYAANLALTAMNTVYATNPDPAHSRVHPIITDGGTAVNTIPGKAKIENMIRSGSTENLATVNRNMNRAVVGASLSMGTGVHLVDMCAYLPGKMDTTLNEITYDLACELVGSDNVHFDHFVMGCNDLNDVACLMPTLLTCSSGARGAGHTKDYRIEDFNGGLNHNAQIQLMLIKRLLENNAAEAARVKKNFHPVFENVQEYLRYLDSLYCDKDAIIYHNDGKVTIHV